MENPKLTPYCVVRREADQWVFVPSPRFVGLMTGMLGAGSALMVYFSTIPFRQAGGASAKLWLGAIFLLVAGYSVGLAIWAWRARRTPLSIESGGRVSYGKRELCAAGTVRSVWITGARGGDAGDCEVGLEVAGGKIVFLPNPYFSSCTARAHARPFAAKLAEALEVQVTESFPRWWRRIV